MQEETPKVVAMAVITAYGPFDCKKMVLLIKLAIMTRWVLKISLVR
jgi:hypothetical protein